MLFKRRQMIKQPKATYDEQLLGLLNSAKVDWDRAKQNEQAIYDNNTSELVTQTALARAKYLYLYREARRRQVHGSQIQRSVIDK
ncbi:YaaL family protein [Lactiplantibacillus sp. WILCCON 0030]|uniref:YaaL family protein n=2 Tax=Lactiplantibacillus brownii TaxID=3069269 RepID=A0ABU1A793_9LACO|nr:YaaL family protein [Lactiplantibacillus brownii]MDQ7936540.1 YaaL family protein [Lactiplantibacillus brownii]